jgi:hypothetical protein
MIYSETGDIKKFITVSSFGESLLKQIILFEEAFFVSSQENFQAPRRSADADSPYLCFLN